MSGKLDLVNNPGLGMAGPMGPQGIRNGMPMGRSPMTYMSGAGTGTPLGTPWGGLYSGFGSMGAGAGAPANMSNGGTMSGNYGPTMGAGARSFGNIPFIGAGQMPQNALLNFAYRGGGTT